MNGETMENRDEATPQGGDGPAPDEPADELTRLRDERDQLEERLRRSMADLANFRKRQVKDLADARHRAIEALAAELLPVIDNFHLALSAHEQHDAAPQRSEAHAIVEGVRMVRSLLEGTLERHGLAEIPAAGLQFDPNLHEAVGVDDDQAAEPGTVTKVLQRGYRFGDKVLRASRVLVAPHDADRNAGDDRPDSGSEG